MIRVQVPRDVSDTTRRYPRTMHEAFPHTPEAANWKESYTDTVHQYVEGVLLLAAAAGFFTFVVFAPKWWPL